MSYVSPAASPTSLTAGAPGTATSTSLTDLPYSTTAFRPVNYSLRDAIRLVKAFSTRTFPETVELSINLGVDPRKPNQMVRGMAEVPHGSGKKVVLAVFASGEKAVEARAAGAEIVGDEDLVKEILAGKIEFTRCIATPDMMRVVAKVARVLGPRGLMPNPKLGTVTTDVKGAVASSKRGQIEYRVEKKGIVHAPVGRVDWPSEKLEENLLAFVRAIADAKPSGAKGTYFRAAHLSSTMGLGVPLDLRLPPFRTEESGADRA